jgi:hypothetical protein
VFIDLQSIKRTGLKIKVWVKFKNNSDKYLYGFYPTAKIYRSSLALFAYRCDERTSIMLQVIYYADRDTMSEIVYSKSFSDNPSQYENVVPDTNGEILLDFACKVTSPKK